jgi:flagellar hook assembly protein FlgD
MEVIRLMRPLALLACALQALSCASLPSTQLTAPQVPSSFTVEPSPLPPIDLIRVAATPKTFVPGKTDPVTLRFAAASSTPARVEIVDASNALVRAFELPAVGPEGVEVVWDGRDQAGAPAPTGVYLYRMYALDAARKVRGAYGDPPIGGGEEVLAQKFTFDRATGTVDFILPEPARVRLRMSIQRFPVLRTYYNWEPLEAGRHTIEWDGLDTTGKIHMTEHPQFRADLETQGLPLNSVYLRRQNVSTQNPCVELCFRIEFPNAKDVTDDGRPIVVDETTFRLMVDDPQERARLINLRFEVMIFLDTVFLAEEEDGAVPYNYRLDTRALNPGPHLLTVNLLSYDQRVGVQTIEIIKAAP